MTLDESKRLPTGLSYPLGETIPQPGEAVEVADGVLWLRVPLPMKLDHVNIYALDDGDAWTIIDTGFDNPPIREAWEAALAGPLNGKPIGRIFVTHHHPDHMGMAAALMDQTGAPLWTTRTAWLYARTMQMEDDKTSYDASVFHAERHGAEARFLDPLRARGPIRFFTQAPLKPGYKRIKDGDRIEAGGRTWRVFTGDGHAPEHATLWSTDGEIVIAGDQILPRISPNLSVWPMEPEADPVGDWIVSCEKFRAYAKPGHLVLPGHNRPFHGLPKRLAQLIDNHHGALKRLRKALVEPRTAAQCFDAIYKREISTGEYGLALGEAVAHVNHLWLTGEATREQNADGAWVFRMEEAA